MKPFITMPELNQIWIEERDKLDQQMIDDLIPSTPKRWRLCVENESAAIGHILSRTRIDAVRRAELRLKLPKGMPISILLNMTNVGATVSQPKFDQEHIWEARRLYQESVLAFDQEHILACLLEPQKHAAQKNPHRS
jgi:hypothetical protein